MANDRVNPSGLHNMRVRHTWLYYACIVIYSVALTLLGLEQWELWVITLIIVYLGWVLRR
ncbi:MAG: hypothetical protein ACYC4R_13760 [Anaerolineae bacterium]